MEQLNAWDRVIVRSLLRATDEFKESDHPRDESGKFGSVGGEGKSDPANGAGTPGPTTKGSEPSDAWKKQQAKVFEAQKEGEKADQAFQKALTKEYGKNAGTMRYMTAKQTPEIQKLGALFVAASTKAHNETTQLRNTAKS